MRYLNCERNLCISIGSIQWKALSQDERDSYSRMANEENKKKQDEKDQKDQLIASYPYKGPLGSTDPYEFFYGGDIRGN